MYLNSFNHQRKKENKWMKKYKKKSKSAFSTKYREQQDCTVSPPEQNSAHIFSIIKTISKHEECKFRF